MTSYWDKAGPSSSGEGLGWGLSTDVALAEAPHPGPSPEGEGGISGHQVLSAIPTKRWMHIPPTSFSLSEVEGHAPKA